jgi:hypothetical protein
VFTTLSISLWTRNKRVGTMHCQTLAKVWSAVCSHYGSQDAQKVSLLREKMNKIMSSDPKKIPEFLNEIKVTHNALMMAGKWPQRR